MFLKGKLTYAGIAIAALSAIGLSVSAEELNFLYETGLQVTQAVGLITAIYGRRRIK